MAWLLKNAAIMALVGVLGLGVLFGVQRCGESKDKESAIVMKERIRVSDSVIAAKDSALATTQQQLGMALANGTKIVDRWHKSDPPPITTGSPHDSITQLTKQVKECRELGDTLVKSIVEIRSACTAFRDTATKAIAAYKTGLAQRDSLLKIGKPRKRWGIGPYIGYGINTDSAFAMRRGFSAGIAIHYSLFSW